jgi:phenylpropionate dioxygenase-like ring-hydroxylating dioxygenase large terminal subunit
MSKKVSRREFARTSVAAGAAAVTLPGTLFGNEAEPTSAAAATGAAAGKQAAIARRRVTPPAQGFGYGGGDIGGRGVSEPLQDAAGVSQAAAVSYPGGWTEGHTIPAEYYIDEKHYLADERFIADHLWLMADHESRIPNAGDYFVFEYGRGESAIILRDRAGAVKAYYNVCRHRGSRLCRHDEDPTPKDSRLSVKQLGPTGNTPVFRCPYHAWTYDLDGRLVAAYGMPADFDAAQNGLRPCHLQTAEGFIFVNFSRQEPPDFAPAVSAMRTLGQRYGTAQLKVGARVQYPTRANWKLALENFLECYHCGPAHRSLVTTHDWDYSISTEQRARREPEMERWVPPQVRPGGTGGMGQATPAPGIVGRGFLRPGYVTGSLDGKPVAPLLPNFKEYTHGFRETTTAWSTAYWAAYDDYVAVARFTPRGVAATDAEIIWLVNPAAREGKDYQIDRLTALWDVTMREDKWIVENNHQGIQCSGGYASGRYATHEVGRGSPGAFIKWYMTDVVPAAERHTA